MRRYSDWRWTQIGALGVLMAACNGGGGNLTASETQGGETADTSATEPGVTTTQGGVTDSGSVTEVSGTDSDSDGETTGTTEATATTDPDPTTGSEPDTTTTTTDPGTSTEGVETETDGETDGETEGQACALATMHLPCDAESNDALHALGINCTSLGGGWQADVNAVSASKIVLEAAPETLGMRAYQVAKSYGSFVDPNTQMPFWGPREGEKVLLISSGLLPAPNVDGAVIIADGDVYNDVAFGGPWDSDVMPPPMSPQEGSPSPMGFVDCDGTNDCSNTIWDQWQNGLGSPEDKMWLGFELTAPAIANGMIADANGFSFDFAFFSAEFPEFVDTEYNDIFVVWQASENYTGNITFINGQPLTVTALWPVDYPSFDPHLAGTGHTADGGATGWYKATSGVNPGETFTLTFGIFDMFDSIYDTTAILDNWQWDCEGCVPNEIDSCGIAPQ